MTEEVTLSGLAGTNPLAFLAALGAQVAVAHEDQAATLRWTNEARPVAVLASTCDADGIARATRKYFDQVLDGKALDSGVVQTLKFDGENLRRYLADAREDGAFSELAQCLVAENSFSQKGEAKPTEFYFLTGQQAFVKYAREFLESATHDDLIDDLTNSWRYESNMKSLMWDIVRDRVYALSAFNPTDSTNNPKKTNAGAEALAVVGLSQFPCFRSPRGTATVGYERNQKQVNFTWPLWTRSASTKAVKSLLAHVSMPEPTDATRAAFERHSAQYEGWGISQVVQSQIRRRGNSEGYGTFGPPRVIWKRG